MNILMLLYKDIHFDARVKREALALAEAGHQIYLACVKEYQSPPPHIHNNIKLIRTNISVKSIKSSISNGTSTKKKPTILNRLLVWTVRTPVVKIIKDYLAYYEFYKKVKSSVNGMTIDVIHCHDLNTLWQGSMLAKDFSAKLVYDSHEIFNEMAGRNRLDRIVGYRVENLLFKKIDYFVTVNEFLRDYLFEKNGKKPSVLIQNIPIFDQQDLNANQDMFAKYGFTKADTILLYQGGFSPYRGLELIIKAMGKLPAHFKLVMIGSGVLKEELEKLVTTLQLEQRVFFHEQVPSEELMKYTAQAHIGLVMYEKVSKNNYYSTPNKIFEYLQAGIPAVSSNHPGKSVIIEKYKTGVLVDENVEAIVNGIHEVMNEYNQFQENCFQAQKELTWDNEKQKLVQLYQQLAEQS